ncbi:DUF2339 domain-containing protein [Microbulbifer aggregans]|uniref:DUF2339 domain-containing protein n=1 Tax=Microbulbifer aggregans TaxID=1769779 RepID=UPI001CFE3CE3|nr:DUF2339 domain-containing protein [Microbulbifer aggregans]
MDGFVFFGLLVLLLMISGSLLGLVSYFEVRRLRAELHQLRGDLAGAGTPEYQAPQRASSVERPEVTAVHREAAVPPALDTEPGPSIKPEAVPQRAPVAGDHPKKASFPLWSRIQENWMVWLGGACVALAGIFLARYGIEQGLLGPRVRVALGLVTAGALYLFSEFLRRKTGGSHPAFAALAGGGAITAFAAILSAVHLYHLFAPGLAFALLAVVATVTMWMARLHGPVLAAIGMIGAYSVPVLVSTGSGNVLAAMVYALIISVSVLLLLRHVYRSWLWLGLLAGALGWWLVSLLGHQADGWRGPYLATLAYLLLAVIPGDWLLRKGVRFSSDEKSAVAREALLLPSLLALVAAQCLSILQQGFSSDAFWQWSPLALVLLLGARERSTLAPLPWALLLGQCAVWLVTRLVSAAPDPGQVGSSLQLLPWPAGQQGGFLMYLLATAALFSALSLVNLRSGMARYWWASLAVLAPLLCLVVGYLLAGSYLAQYVWVLLAAILGAVYLYLGSLGAGKSWPKAAVVWLFAAGHFGYSVAACLWLAQASLTLALAAQAVSLAWIIRRFEVPGLGWLLKGVLLLVVIRLSLNPWLLAYAPGTHWSLWTYGGSALCAWLAARLLLHNAGPAYANLGRWAEATALHLLVLALWAECRYWLYGGNAFAAEFSFKEAVVNVWLFAGLGMVYYRKSLVSGSFARWYDGYGRVLMFVALATYLRMLVSVADSDGWAWRSVGERPLWNLLLPAFAGPALLAFLASRYYLPAMRSAAALVAAAAGFIWVSLEVRHLWQGNIRISQPAETGELYTYSAVWLLLAVGAILLGSWRGWRSCYQGGMAVLALVIVKLFLVDMSGLEGLLRVASFMGLGLALLGIAYLHQKLAVHGRNSAQ